LPKKKVEAPKRELTKRQLTHHQRQSRIQRFTLWGGIAILVAVAALIGTGLFLNNVKPNQQVVFKVGNTSYNMGYFIDAVDYYGPINYSYFSSYGIDYTQYIGYTINSYASTIQENQIIKEAAAKLDPPITVTDAEINQYIKDNKLTKNKAVIDAVYGTLLDTKLTDKFDKALPATAEQRAVLAMSLESQTEVDNVTSRLKNGETFNSIAETSSLDSTTKSKSGDLGWVARGVIPTTLGTADDKTLDNLVFSPDTKINILTDAKDDNMTKNLGYWIIQLVDTKTIAATPAPDNTTAAASSVLQAQVKAMLLGSKELALDMKKQLAGGADFETLAKANSQYTNAATDGGNLGYIEKGKLGTAVDAVLFSDDATKMLKNGEISDPILDTAQTTKGGFWIAQVTGIEVKTLDGTNRTTLTNIDKQAWKDKAWADNSSSVNNLLTTEMISYATTQAVNRYNKSK
jgi:hypothetical protein